MVAVAAITCDGIAVGTITVGEEGEVSTGLGVSPLSAPMLASLGDAGNPFHRGSGAPSSYQGSDGEQPSPTHQPHVAEHRQSREHKEHIRPGRHAASKPPVHTGTYEVPHEKHGPTFRPGLEPRGKAPIATPPHFTTGDVSKAVGKDTKVAPKTTEKEDSREPTFAKREKEKPESTFAAGKREKAQPVKEESTFATGKREKAKPVKGEPTFATKSEHDKEELKSIEPKQTELKSVESERAELKSTEEKKTEAKAVGPEELKAIEPKQTELKAIEPKRTELQEKPEHTFPNIKRGTGGIDRSQFQDEIDKHPELIKKMAWMVKGEVLGSADTKAKIGQLETLFNRAQVRDDTLKSALRSVTEGGTGGRAGPYYAGKNAPGGGTYAPSKEPSDAEVKDFKENVLAPVMAGSNTTDTGKGPMTGNASDRVAAHEIARHVPHTTVGHGGDTLFQEDPKSALDQLPRLGASSRGLEVDKPTGSQPAGAVPVGVTRLGPGRPESTFAKMSRNVPSRILDKAEEVAKLGGAPAVYDFMRKSGHPKDGNWCGEFAASVVQASGGTPPSGEKVASNWRNWGKAVDTPQPGDIAVRRNSYRRGAGYVPTGNTGSHVTIIESVDPSTGTFVGIGGNQGSDWAKSRRRTQFLKNYEFRRGEDTPHDKQSALTQKTKIAALSSRDYTNSTEYEGAPGDRIRMNLKKIERERPGMKHKEPGKPVEPGTEIENPNLPSQGVKIT